MRTRSVGLLSLLASLTFGATAAAQESGCDPEALGCTRAPIAYRWREGLPVEFDFDTGWVPSGAPVQVRLRAALAGHTEVAAAGELVGSWPEPLRLRTVGTPGAGSLSVDYGVQFSARIRLALNVDGRTLSWEGAIPYTPMIDFRAMASTPFDPWAWRDVMTAGRTMRVRVADVPLTDAIVRIPGISGGFTFEASGEVQARYHSTRFTFGTAADPITESTTRVLAVFNAGPFAEYYPRLEGALAYSGAIHVYPGLYVSLAGRRWMLDLVDLPIPIGPFPRDVVFDPARAHLPLPDIQAATDTVDFGDVDLGRESERTVELTNTGELDGRILGAEVEAPFSVTTRSNPLPARSRSSFLVRFTPVRPGLATATFLVNTNDPDTPRVRVTVRGNGVASYIPPPPPPPPQEDASVAEDATNNTVTPGATQDGGCGCRSAATHESAGPWMLVALFSAASRARRRRPRRG